MATENDKRVSDLYDKARATNLWEAYGSHSRAKDEAWVYCRALCYKYGGHGLKVLTANTFQFTAAFLYTDAETGRRMVMRITKAHDTPHEYTGHEW